MLGINDIALLDVGEPLDESSNVDLGLLIISPELYHQETNHRSEK